MQGVHGRVQVPARHRPGSQVPPRLPEGGPQRRGRGGCRGRRGRRGRRCRSHQPGVPVRRVHARGVPGPRRDEHAVLLAEAIAAQTNESHAIRARDARVHAVRATDPDGAGAGDVRQHGGRGSQDRTPQQGAREDGRQRTAHEG